MRRWLSLVALVAAIFFLGSLGLYAQNGLELKGSLHASDMERERGLFRAGARYVRPGSPEHKWLKAHAGQTVLLMVEPAR
jgi:hypothetical protein